MGSSPLIAFSGSGPTAYANVFNFSDGVLTQSSFFAGSGWSTAGEVCISTLFMNVGEEDDAVWPGTGRWVSGGNAYVGTWTSDAAPSAAPEPCTMLLLGTGLLGLCGSKPRKKSQLNQKLHIS